MKEINKIFYKQIFIQIFSLFCFIQTTEAQNPSKIISLRIDPSSAISGTVSQLIDSVSFIPLESNDKCAFGHIDQLQVTEKYFIILDHQTNAVLIFERNGKFHAKIEGRKAGYSSGYKIYKFYFNRFTKQIQIPTIPTPIKISGHSYVPPKYFTSLCFTTDGKFKKKIRVITSPGDKYILNKKETAYYRYQSDPRNSDSIAYVLSIINDSMVTKKYFPYNMKTANLKSNDILYSAHICFYPLSDSSLYFLRPYDYKVYTILSDTMSATYQFIFPAYVSLPKNFVMDSALNYKRISFLTKHKDIIYGLSNVYKIGNNLFFKTQSHDHFSMNSYLYNLKSHTLVVIDKISPDKKSYFLPVTDARMGQHFRNDGFMTRHGDFLFTSYSSLILFQQKDISQNKSSNYPPILSQYFSDKKNIRGNPIIIQLRFKSML